MSSKPRTASKTPRKASKAPATPSLHPNITNPPSPKPPQPVPSSYPQPGRPSRPNPPVPPPQPRPTHRPHSAPAEPLQSEPLPPGFEVLIELNATITEKLHPNTPQHHNFHGVPPLPPPQPSAPLLVIQGPLATDPSQPNANMLYYAFINTRSYNFPLMPSTSCRRIAQDAFRIRVDNRRFVVALHPSTPPKHVEGFIALLQWFCTWKEPEGSLPPARLSESTTSSTSSLPTTPPLPPPKSTVFTKIGDNVVDVIEKVSNRANNTTQRYLSEKHSTAVSNRNRGAAKDLNIGGRATAGVLGTTQKVVGAVAKVAVATTDKIACTVGRRVTKTVAKPLASAPERSIRRGFYDQIASGCLAAGRIYVSVDKNVRLFMANTGDTAALVAGAKYGPQAEHASRQIAQIAYDAYHVMKFPSELGYKSLMKSSVEEELKRKGDDTTPDDQVQPPPSWANEASFPPVSPGAVPSSAVTGSPMSVSSAAKASSSAPAGSPAAVGPAAGASTDYSASTTPSSSAGVVHIPIAQEMSLNLPKTT
ncbi:hypothetical protein BWQ96_02415 [Gracilariopsis chorda]|uniref:Senescence domain-containing protein n=1 Tax=Gracilariopsis chorda TaxID=448386 RepID=A0A2V3J0A0_9FLOR|nr:hypothetical protein BWQ96_02415 [Gracilariopsis chorda]|eukprot:PXF47733.1 hypothetical protein BWQ96_02415 [Gracilariopsis chorda]